MDDLRGPFKEWLDAGTAAHPDSPAGGAGPGSGRLPSALTAGAPWSRLVHPDSPAARSAIADRGPHRPPAPSAGDAWVRLLPQIDSSTETHAAQLRDSLSDLSLRDAFGVHVAHVGLRYRRAAISAHQANLGTHIVQRLHDLVEWVDPSYFAGFADRRAVREVFASAHTAYGCRSRLAAVTTSIEGVFAEAITRATQRWEAAAAAGRRQEYALLHVWLRRLELYALALHGRALAEPRQEVKRFTPKQLVPPPTEKTWVEFQLVDQKGRPVPDERYEVTLPGGGRRTGKLNSKGQLRFDDIDPGQCQIRFPDIDGREWRPI